MTTTTATTRTHIDARPAGFLHDVGAIAGRALRAVPRDKETIIPPILAANRAAAEAIGPPPPRGTG